jgi:uncharacterized protein YneF (UPF0154 family)
MAIMTVYVTETLHLDVLWAGIALGVAAARLVLRRHVRHRPPLFQKMIPRLGLSTGL